MNKKVTIREAVNYVINSKGEKHTLLGIGPMSENFLRASLEISKEKDFPLMYIASRNQVDAYKFGGGYVFNSDQKLFKEKSKRLRKKLIMIMSIIYAVIMVDHGKEIKKEQIIYRKMKLWQLPKSHIKKIF